MADGSSPTLHLLLTPKTTTSGDITGLRFSITISGLVFKEGDFLCTYGRHDEAHSSRIQLFLKGISAALTDSHGPAPFLLSGQEEKQVRLARETIGDVTFTSDARILDEEDGRGEDSAALLCDQGGLVGAGRGFLPRFGLGKCQVVLAWNLNRCPQGTRAVSSFGEGPDAIQVLGDDETILDCVFMVGPVQSFPPDEPGTKGSDADKSGFGGTYWLGDLPQNLDAVKDYATNTLPRMTEHFNDGGSSYRAFLRKLPRGLRGTAFRASSIIDYDEDTRAEDDWDLIRVLNRTMVSNWVRLDSEDDGTENTWFNDGLSHLYTVYLPFRFGQREPDYFRATVNAFLSAYYTNPLVSAALSQLDALGQSHDWYRSSAKTLRAFVYMLKMDTYTRRAAVSRGVDVMRPLDDLVGELCARRMEGQRVQKRDWMEGIAHWIGREDAERHFREMLEEGRVNELDDVVTSFGGTYGPQPVEQETLDFGFERRSLDEGCVKGVVGGSRAQEAGLKDGDVIVWHSKPWLCELHFEGKFSLAVEREGEQLTVEYWPRSKEKVRCWQVLERPRPDSGLD